MSEEEWREIPGFERYEVSNLGQVRSWRTRGHGGYRAKHPRILTQRLTGVKGHERWAVRLENRVTTVHRLVLLAFVGSPPGGQVGCHNDGNRDNNALDNLRWDTQRANAADQVAHGTAPIGEQNPAARLTEEDVTAIRKAPYHRGLAKELSQQYGVTHWHIRAIRRGRCWNVGG
ncbi:NUMOD4 motif-containing HNH endonuclease [Micromonospora sp. CB01531]|uniref:NUMOD4 motif-containing HNH endonuclease n=1 Tax=Micromonospora sp. CB01531 TaxID=1718947 RepID=UPI00093C3C6A